jgi:hypothetical protein
MFTEIMMYIAELAYRAGYYMFHIWIIYTFIKG